MALLFALNSKGLPRLRNASNHLLLLFVLTFMNARLSLASPFFIPTVRAQVLQTKNVTQTFSSSKQETSHSHHHNTAWAGGVYGVNGQQSQPQVSAPPIPQVVPERQPQPQPVPQVVPQAVPQPIPEPVPQTLPQAIPQPVPQPVPQNVPQQIPQAVNGVYAPPQPSSGYYVPLQPVVPVQPYYVPQSGYSVEIEARKRKRAAPKTTTKDPNRWHRLNVGYSGTGAAGPARNKQNMGTTTKGPTKDPLRWHRLNMGAIGKK